MEFRGEIVVIIYYKKKKKNDVARFNVTLNYKKLKATMVYGVNNNLDWSIVGTQISMTSQKKEKEKRAHACIHQSWLLFFNFATINFD